MMSTASKAFSLLVFVSVIGSIEAAGNDNALRRLRTSQETRSIESVSLHDNEAALDSYRFQPKYQMNGHSYFVKKSTKLPFLGEESQQQVRRLFKQDEHTTRQNRRMNSLRKKLRRHKLKHDWHDMFTKARRSVIGKISTPVKVFMCS